MYLPHTHLRVEASSSYEKCPSTHQLNIAYLCNYHNDALRYANVVSKIEGFERWGAARELSQLPISSSQAQSASLIMPSSQPMAIASILGPDTSLYAPSPKYMSSGEKVRDDNKQDMNRLKMKELGA